MAETEPGQRKTANATSVGRERRQAAAVCYRAGKRGIEFLLVQTRGGRWIFPKGGVEPGLTHAQSAALEAVEEAGVHGRMEEIAFTRYFRPRSETASGEERSRRFSERVSAVTAHLCEVLSLEPPRESRRRPTWFSVEKTKRRLRQDRTPEFGAELSRVVDHAVSRIQRLRHQQEIASRSANPAYYKDPLHRVHFDASVHSHFHFAEIQAAVRAHFRLARQLGAAAMRRPTLRLGAGAAAITETPRNVTPNVTPITSARRTDAPHRANPPSRQKRLR
jgi:8-oxo-dGTP pyrophosphatase MutT (NUDIX family)